VLALEKIKDATELSIPTPEITIGDNIDLSDEKNGYSTQENKLSKETQTNIDVTNSDQKNILMRISDETRQNTSVVSNDYGITDAVEIFNYYREAVLHNSIAEWKALADKLMAQEKHDDAILVYKNIIKSTGIEKDTNMYISTLSKLANIYLENGEKDKAKEIYMKTLSINSDKIDKAIIALDSFNLGDIYKDENDITLARVMYMKSKEYFEKSGGDESSIFIPKISERISELQLA
jgi:tetratricopeptide (TPR) repeat protein